MDDQPVNAAFGFFPPRPHVSADKPAELLSESDRRGKGNTASRFLIQNPNFASVGNERREHERLVSPCQKKALLRLF